MWPTGSDWDWIPGPGREIARCQGVIAYLEHAGVLIEMRTLEGVLVYRDPRITPDIEGQSLG
jgi:hypothetical protein